MRSAVLALALGGALVIEAQSIETAPIDLGPLATGRPTSTKSVNRQASASSIMSVMSERKPKAAAATTVRKAKTTSKKTTTKKTTTKKKTTKKVAIPKAAKKAVKKGKRAAVAPVRGIKIPDSPCSNQTVLYGYAPNPNTPDKFLVDNLLGGLSTGASIGLAGYTQNFQNQFGAIIGDGYLGYFQLSTYSPASCAAACDGTPGCTFFNIYIERSPLQDPTAGRCENPTAASSVNCALYSKTANATQATNIGQWRANFLTVEVASNGYVKNAVPPMAANFDAPVALAGVSSVTAIDGKQVFLRTVSQTGSIFRPSICTSACLTATRNNRQTAANAGNSTYNACNYYTAAFVTTGSATGTICSLYTTSDVAAYANVSSQASAGSSSVFTNVYGFALSTPDRGVLPDPLIAATWNASTFVDSSGKTYNVLDKYSVNSDSSADLGSQGLITWARCINQCAKTAGCTGVNFNAGYAGCAFKNMSAIAKPTVSADSSNNWSFMYIPSSLQAPLTYQ